jgi:hypothetical protein
METTSLSCRDSIPISCDGVTAGRDDSLGMRPPINPVHFKPFDEIACQTLMRAHAAAGNRAEALRVYVNCRRLFLVELKDSLFLNIGGVEQRRP